MVIGGDDNRDRYRKQTWLMIDIFHFLWTAPDADLLYIGSYNPLLVLVSVLLATIASYAALNASTRIGYQPDRAGRLSWSVISALTLGVGIWAMHFVGMLAFHLPCNIHYDPLITLVSMLPGILAGGVALGIAWRHGTKHLSALAGSALLGLGIGTMHYTGMAAMKMQGMVGYNPGLFGLSIVVAMLLSYLALRVQGGKIFESRQKNMLIALMLGGAVSGMHYTAMSAAYFIRGSDAVMPADDFTSTTLAVFVSIITVFMALSTLTAAAVSRNRETTRLLRLSEERLKIATATGQVGIWDLDLQTNELVWDDTMFELYGVRRGDFSGAYDAWSTRLHPDDMAEAEAVLREAIAGAREYQPEFRVVWPDGEVHYIKGHGHVVKDHDGTPLRMIGINWDNKAHVMMQQQLKFAHAAINKSRSAFFWMNAEGQVTDINDYACESLGYSRKELIGQSVWFFDQKFFPEFWAAHWRELEKKLTFTFESWHRRQDGLLFPVEITNHYIVVDGVGYCFSFSQDLTERKQAELRLRISATAFEAQEAMVITDTDNTIIQVNSAFIESTGFSAEELVGENIGMLNSGRHDQAFYEAMAESIQRTGSWQGEIWDRRKNGEIYQKWLTVTAVKNDDGWVTHHVCIHTDITERKLAEEKIRHLAFYDPLTDLPNRRLLLERLKHCMDVYRRDGKQMALLMMDLDRFKAVNDTLGHLAGDDLLRQAADRIKTRLREVDMVARLGGDEFVVVLDNISHPDDAARVATEIVADLSADFQLGWHGDVQIGASIGISLYPQHGGTPELLMEHADRALYRAKALGRGCFAYFSEEMTDAARARMDLESRLRQALSRQELRLYFQPQVEIASGRVVAAQAVVYWQNPQDGLIPLVGFVPIVRETGLILDVDAWTLREACRQGRSWMEHGLPECKIAVSLSVQLLRHGDIAALLAEVLEETAFPARQLQLEINESVLMDNQEKVRKLLRGLQMQGISIAVDDFGMGYSSLALLRRFDLDVLKIDKSLIDEIPGKIENREMAAAIVAMGHKFGNKVVAEGVETREQLVILREKGCDRYQGVINSPPLAAEDFAALLQVPALAEAV